MPTVLNPTTLDALTSKGAVQVAHWDALCPGLAIIIAKTGRKTWSFTYTSPRDGKRARVKLGTYPATPLKDARIKAEAARAQVEANLDPRDAAAATVAPKTIAQLIEERLEMKVRGKLRSAKLIEWRYNKYVIPHVGKVAVKDFQIDPHYNSLVDPLLKRGKTRQAGIVYQDMTALFAFGIQRGVIEYSRMARAERPDSYVPRERFLTKEEIVAVWHGLPTVLAGSKNVQRIVKLLLVTGQRLSEVGSMTRHEIDMHNRVWTLPKERAKNGREHKIPLSDLAVEIIGEAMRSTNDAYLFPNDAKTGPLVHHVIDTTLRRAQQARPDQPFGKFGIPVWRPHDLRRTCATHMSRLEVPHMSISHVLNHITSTKATITQAVYDKHDYLAEKKAALDKWGAFLAKLVGADVQQQEAA